MRGHPYVDLFETCFEAFFELLEELTVFVRVGDIHENAGKFVAKRSPLMALSAVDDLSLRRDRTELGFQCQENFNEELVGYGPLIVIPPRQQELVPPVRSAHRLPGPRQ